jgi:hypothetical protein
MAGQASTDCLANGACYRSYGTDPRLRRGALDEAPAVLRGNVA